MPDIISTDKPDIVSTEKKEGERYSADEIRQMTVDQPFLLSGDYFRERTQKPVKLSELLSKGKKTSKLKDSGTEEFRNSGTEELRNSGTEELRNSGTEELRNSGTEELKNSGTKEFMSQSPDSSVHQPLISQSPNLNSNSPVSESPDSSIPKSPNSSIPKSQIPKSPNSSIPESQIPKSFRVKAGFILDYESISAETAEQIISSMPKVAEMLPVVFADQDHISEVLANTDCLRRKDLFCVSKAVGVYPGVRMLALIELFEVPKEMPGAAKVKMALVDTGLEFRYPLMEITAQVKNKNELNYFIIGVMHKIFDYAHRKSDAMPWFCRSFSREEESWYISAGKASGLKLGDKLNVVPKGKLVKSPAGLPAGWIPGKPKGILKVEQMFGKDFAVCSLVQGKGPVPEDMLLQTSR